MKRTLLLTTVAALSLTAITPALAAAQEEQQAAASQPTDTILVTARRREESLLETPVSVSAFGEAEIRRLGIQSVDDVARFAPGLSFSAAFGRSTERPVIRGQSNVLAGVQFGVESGTAYFVDGIYYPSTIQNLDPNDIQRVEVIRGPQSALYGRNTYAGAINFVTQGASDEMEINGRARVGNHGEDEVSLSLSGPITDTLGFRFALRNYSYDGEHRNLVTNELVGSESTFSASILFDWAPSDNFDVRLRYMWSQDDDGPLPIFLQSSEMNNCMPGYRSLAYWPRSGSTNNNQYYCGTINPGQVALNTGPAVNAVTVPGVPGNATYTRFNNLPFLPPFDGPYSTRDGTAFDGIERDQRLFSALVNWDIGGSGYVLTLSGAHRSEDEWQGFDSDHSAVNLFNPLLGDEAFFANTGRDEIEDYSVDVRLSSPVDRAFRYSIGAFLYDQESTGFDITFADPQGSTVADISTVRNTAIYALGEIDITPALTLTVEGRYAEEEKEVIDLPFTGTATFDNFTPRVTLNWSMNDSTTLYGVFAQGVKPGGLNGDIGASVGIPTYDQETSNNYEIGYKREMFDGAGFLQVAGYFTQASDVQLTTPVASGTGALTSIATNQGSADILGLEVEWSHVVNDSFRYGMTYAWTRPEFTEGCDDFQWALTSGGGLINPGTNTGTNHFGATGNCSIVGNRLPLTSEHQFSANAEYRQPFGDFGSVEWFARSNYSYESSKFVQVHNLAETGDAHLLDGQLGLEGENWSVNFYGRNLLDEDSIVMATRWLQTPYFTFASQNTAPTTGADRGAPRAFFGTLRRGRAYGIEGRFRF